MTVGIAAGASESVFVVLRRTGDESPENLCRTEVCEHPLMHIDAAGGVRLTGARMMHAVGPAIPDAEGAVALHDGRLLRIMMPALAGPGTAAPGLAVRD